MEIYVHAMLPCWRWNDENIVPHSTIDEASMTADRQDLLLTLASTADNLSSGINID